jgi:cell filamentation protein
MPDPYSYAGTGVLKNRLRIRDAAKLQQFEVASVSQRASEPLPNGRFGTAHYRAVHRHLFGDVYGWAGRYRTVRIAKDGSVFCYPENITSEMNNLFLWLKGESFLNGLPANAFAPQAAHFLATLNAIHPFREGNGRTQMAFVSMLASRAGHPLATARLHEPSFLAAMIASFAGDEGLLSAQVFDLIE